MSWWRSPSAPVPVALRQRGDRTPRGRSARAADHGHQKRHLLAARAIEEERRATACAELLAVGGRLADARLSAPAMTVLLELLANAAAGGRASLPDNPVTVWMAPAEGTLMIQSDLGSLAIEGRSVLISSTVTEPIEGRDEAAM